MEADAVGVGGPAVGCAPPLGVDPGDEVACGGVGVGAGVGVALGHGGFPAPGSMVKVEPPESLPREPLAARAWVPEAAKHAGAGWVMLAVHRPLPAM